MYKNDHRSLVWDCNRKSGVSKSNLSCETWYIYNFSHIWFIDFHWELHSIHKLNFPTSFSCVIHPNWKLQSKLSFRNKFNYEKLYFYSCIQAFLTFTWREWKMILIKRWERNQRSSASDRVIPTVACSLVD